MVTAPAVQEGFDEMAQRSMKILFSALGVLALGAVGLGTTGCVIRTRTPTTTVRVQNSGQQQQQPPPQQQQGATVVVQGQTTATGVTVIEASCTPGAQEACNGLDDNCDGRIDEGCGYQSGNIQITLGWNTGADLDMYVTDPNGETIYYGHNTSSSGGNLDHDARGNCGNGQSNSQIENIYWNQPNPPHGTYNVEVHYWSGSACSTSAGPTTLSLAIAVGGQVIGSYRYNINPNQRVSVTIFTL